MAVLGAYLLTTFLLVTAGLAAGDLASLPESAIRHPDCPLVDDAQHPVQLPYKGNCSKYYSCVQGVAYPKACPGDLGWSLLTYRCDYPEVAKCVEVEIEPIAMTSTMTTTTVTDVPLLGGISLPIAESTHYQEYPNDCNRYYQCEVMRCPNNLQWNARLQRCDFPHMTECAQALLPSGGVPATSILPQLSTDVIPTAATPPPTPVPPTVATTTQVAGGVATVDLLAICKNTRQQYIPYPGDCNKFIQCNGIAYVKTCPTNLQWNSQLLTCDRFCK